MTVAQRRQKLKRHIDAIPPESLDDAERYLLSLDGRRKALTPGDAENITRMKARITRANKQFAAGKGIPVEMLKRKY